MRMTPLQTTPVDNSVKYIPKLDSNGHEKHDVNITSGTDLNNISSKADEIFKKYSHLQITDSTPIPPPVAVVKINGEDISTEGAITTISGASKSGKTAFINLLIAGAISPDNYDGFPDIEIMPANGK